MSVCHSIIALPAHEIIDCVARDSMMASSTFMWLLLAWHALLLCVAIVRCPCLDYVHLCCKGQLISTDTYLPALFVVGGDNQTCAIQAFHLIHHERSYASRGIGGNNQMNISGNLHTNNRKWMHTRVVYTSNHTLTVAASVTGVLHVHTHGCR